MPALARSYICNPVVVDDQTVRFECSQDVSEWPWLALPPQHPLVIQTQHFWSSVGASQALQSRDDDKWSALIWTKWQLGHREAQIATHGQYCASGEGSDGKHLDFAIELFDEQDRLIVALEGKGVVFRTRDFESWREKSKQAASNPSPAPFEFADATLLGLSDEEPSLIAPLTKVDGKTHTTALITKDNGLMPGHPYFSGSGDHVNAPHLGEVSRQLVCQINDGQSPLITEGEMDMHRYIELGTPFDIRVEEQSGEQVALAISQLGKSCAKISLQWENRNT